jgi:hypothetical protein
MSTKISATPISPSTICLIDVFRNAIASYEITAGSDYISAILGELYWFEGAALGLADDLRAARVLEHGTRAICILGRGLGSAAEIPGKEQVRSIKSQQSSISREREKIIQGIQSRTDGYETIRGESIYNTLDGSGSE